MTTLADRPPLTEESVPALHLRFTRASLETAAVAAVVLWWAGPMTRDLGGRGPGKVAVALLVALPALALTAPWRRLGRWHLTLTVLVPLGALAATFASPSGWYGADVLGSITLGSVTAALVTAWAGTLQRRQLMMSALVLAGLVEFVQAFLPWWGGGDATRPMIGTFYWWNPFAAFLLPGALLGIAQAVHGARPWRLVGWLAAPFCAAGVVLSSSRTSLGLLLVGSLWLGLLSVLPGPRGRRFGRWLAVLALCAGCTYALTGPPFFDHRVGISSSAQSRAAGGQTAEQNGAYRLQFWERSLVVVAERPLFGGGAHELVNASAPHVPSTYARSNLAHNGYLQPLSDGGLVEGLPFVLACAGIVVAGARCLVGARAKGDDRWLRIALPVALGASMAHSGVDFDWSHPSDMVLTAILAGLVLSLRQPKPVPNRFGAASMALVLPLLLVSAVGTWIWDDTTRDINHTLTAGRARPATTAVALRAKGEQPMRDYRWAAAVLQLAQEPGVSAGDVRWALDRTASVASVDPQVQLLRAQALAAQGQTRAAAGLVDAEVRRLGPLRYGGIADSAATVLSLDGQRERARTLLTPFFVPGALDDHAGQHLKALLRIDEKAYDDLDRCAYTAVAVEVRTPDTPDPGSPAHPAACLDLLEGARP